MYPAASACKEKRAEEGAVLSRGLPRRCCRSSLRRDSHSAPIAGYALFHQAHGHARAAVADFGEQRAVLGKLDPGGGIPGLALAGSQARRPKPARLSMCSIFGI